MNSFRIPTREEIAEFNWLLVRKTLAKIKPKGVLILKQDWLNLNEDTRHDIEYNWISKPVDVITGYDGLLIHFLAVVV